MAAAPEYFHLRPEVEKTYEVKGLALPEFMIEIELEAHKSR